MFPLLESGLCKALLTIGSQSFAIYFSALTVTLIFSLPLSLRISLLPASLYLWMERSDSICGCSCSSCYFSTAWWVACFTVHETFSCGGIYYVEHIFDSTMYFKFYTMTLPVIGICPVGDLLNKHKHKHKHRHLFHNCSTNMVVFRRCTPTCKI